MLHTSANDLPSRLQSQNAVRPLSNAAPARHRLTALAVFAFLAAAPYAPQNAAAASAEVQAQRQPLQPVLPSFSPLVERVAPAVVSIRVKANPAAITARDDEDDGGGPGPKDNPFDGTPLERFFNGSKAPFPHGPMPGKGNGPMQPVLGQGSGFFISPDGYIVTNNHVVEGAIKVDVVTDSGDILKAKVIGTDPGSDLALVKVQGSKPFPYVPLGHSEVKIGDWVIALGNPFGLEGTVTAGIVSAHGRDIGMGAYDNFIQIDAPVNKGNSGGPTFNQAGEVIGVNTAIFSPSGGSVGIAFAIPAKTVENVIAQLKAKGHVTRGWLGVQVQPVTPELADSLGIKKARGALVSIPLPGSPAEEAGIKRGDVIVKIGEADVKDSRDVAREISAIAPQTPVKIGILRAGKSYAVNVRLTELQDDGKPESSPYNVMPKAEITALGLSVAPAGDGRPGSAPGLAVVEINPSGKSADTGLMPGDVIVNVNGTDVSSPAGLESALRAVRASGKNHALAFVQRGPAQVYIALPASVS